MWLGFTANENFPENAIVFFFFSRNLAKIKQNVKFHEISHKSISLKTFTKIRKFSQFFEFLSRNRLKRNFARKAKIFTLFFRTKRKLRNFRQKMFVCEKLETIFPFGHVDSEDWFYCFEIQNFYFVSFKKSINGVW